MSPTNSFILEIKKGFVLSLYRSPSQSQEKFYDSFYSLD